MAKPIRSSMIVVGALCVGFGLSGCSSGGGLELDPAYWFPDGKKKIAGERREVFPEGVPGVTQGIPPEMVRGNPARESAMAAPQQPQPQAEAEEKPRPRPKKVARPRPAPAPAAEAEPDAQPAPAPRPARSAAKPAPSGAWPQPQAQQQQPQQQPAPASSAWPAPPASGTFTR